MTRKNINFKDSTEHFSTLLRANVPYFWVLTYEESRFINDFYVKVSEKHNKDLWIWSSYLGLIKYDPNITTIARASGPMDQTWQIGKAFEAIKKYENISNKEGSIFIFKDFHTVLTQPVPRILRDFYEFMIADRKTLVFLSPELGHGPSGTKPGIDPTLSKQIPVIRYNLPSRNEVNNHIKLSIAQIREQNPNSKASLKYSEEEIMQFTRSVQGLTETEIDNAITTSLCHLGKIDPKRLLLDKQQIIQRSKILEYIDKSTHMDDVGGLDAAKSYFDAYKDQFSKEAEDYGVEPLKGVILTGIPGCLTGDTLIPIAEKKAGYRYETLESLFYKFSKRHREDQNAGDPSTSIRTLSYKEDAECIGYNEIEEVIDSGIKKVWRIFTEEGKSIKATADHKFLNSNNEYLKLSYLDPGDKILCHRHESPNSHTQIPQIQTIQSIDYVGTSRTYDICMKSPYNNFVANGFIVHNSGKSLIAKAVASQWSLPLLRLDVGKVMAGIVGASEENMRQAIALVEAVSPCILWVDEIEKSLSGTKSSGQSDGGTLSRVFGTLLTAMEEKMKGVITLATANDISSLPPELIRRFNEVLFVDLPVPEEREEIFNIHLKKRKRDAEKIGLDMEKLVEATDLFTGSEIEKAVKESIARAFRNKKKDIDTETLLKACKDTRPIAKVMKEKIDEIREWARTRARYASSLAQAANTPGGYIPPQKKKIKVANSLDNIDEISSKKINPKMKNLLDN